MATPLPCVFNFSDGILTVLIVGSVTAFTFFKRKEKVPGERMTWFQWEKKKNKKKSRNAFGNAISYMLLTNYACVYDYILKRICYKIYYLHIVPYINLFILNISIYVCIMKNTYCPHNYNLYILRKMVWTGKFWMCISIF